MAVKTYLVSGVAKLESGDMRFKLYIRALKPRDAVERVYELIGSRHKARRFQIKIAEVEEVPGDSAPDEVKAFSYIDRVVVY
ncbi:MAG: 50S ribosomal protein L18Ae [Thermoproteus sp. AZ2]|uniref:50S ribosomal protein L18Ae n=1 Tax=Thermoproteus sp. AZ2 TaxID=1609232 RepID=A0ACC6UZ07_9CREN